MLSVSIWNDGDGEHLGSWYSDEQVQAPRKGDFVWLHTDTVEHSRWKVVNVVPERGWAVTRASCTDRAGQASSASPSSETGYRCYHCKQTFSEPLAEEHFGTTPGALARCVNMANAGSFGGPHAPFVPFKLFQAEVERRERAEQALAVRTETGAIAEIAAERRRQIDVERWSEMHDDDHDCGELANAAACYAATEEIYFKAELDRSPMEDRGDTPAPRLVQRKVWPWDEKWWKPKDRRRDLIRAAALIVAEIERIDRRPK